MLYTYFIFLCSNLSDNLTEMLVTNVIQMKLLEIRSRVSYGRLLQTSRISGEKNQEGRVSF